MSSAHSAVVGGKYENCFVVNSCVFGGLYHLAYAFVNYFKRIVIGRCVVSYGVSHSVGLVKGGKGYGGLVLLDIFAGFVQYSHDRRLFSLDHVFIVDTCGVDKVGNHIPPAYVGRNSLRVLLVKQ